MNSIKVFPENQINLTLAEYKTRPERMISDYNREIELMNDYNGRQLNNKAIFKSYFTTGNKIPAEC